MAKKEHPVRKLARKAADDTNEAAGQLEFELITFKGDTAEIDFNVDFSHDTVWATQSQLAALYGVGVPAINKHIANIFGDGELDPAATISKMEIVQTEGGREIRRMVDHYNLDMILSVGYRVNTTKATNFRKWATQTLRAYLVDGFALNEARLRDDPVALKRLAKKIRELRAEEKNVYAGVRDCFKISAVDYDKDSKITQGFYAKLQDKFLYAITNHTASEIVLDRADHKQPNMGLTSTKGAKPVLADVSIGKNYLEEEELYALHLLCEQFLLYAESKAIRGQRLTMAELSKKLDELLAVNEYPVFSAYRGYLKEKANQHATAEYAMYQRRLKREAEAKKIGKK